MRNLRIVAAGVASAAAVAFAISCGSSSSSSAPSPGPGSNPNTITISNNAASPQNITVTRGSQVTFTNNDSRVHDMASDPHPEHTDCPELNQVGFLNPGQSRQSGNLNTARRCGFHDHVNPDNAALRGTITIQ